MGNATCPCCGYRTLREAGAYEVCPVCLWEDDGVVSTGEPTKWKGGPNGISLAEGQEQYRRMPYSGGREPRPDEPKDPDWRPYDGAP